MGMLRGTIFLIVCGIFATCAWMVNVFLIDNILPAIVSGCRYYLPLGFAMVNMDQVIFWSVVCRWLAIVILIVGVVEWFCEIIFWGRSSPEVSF